MPSLFLTRHPPLSFSLSPALLSTLSWFYKALFRPGINMSPEWSDHKWTALSTGVNTPKTHWGCIEIWSLRPHSEVVWATSGHILLAVWTLMCPGPHYALTYLTDVLLVSGSTYVYNDVINNNNRQQQQQQQPAFLVDGVHTKLTVWCPFGSKSQYNRNWKIHITTRGLWGHFEKDGGEWLQVRK